VAENNYTSKYFNLDEVEKTSTKPILEETSEGVLEETNYTSKYFTDIDPSSSTPLADKNPNTFEVMGQTVDQLQASGWAGWRVLGEQFGNERMIEAGNRGVAFNEAQASKYGRPMIVEDIEDVGDAVDYVFTNALPQVLPSIAVSLPTAFLGAKLGAAAGTILGPVGAAGGAIVGGTIGGIAGAFLPSAFLSAGEIDREMKARAGDDYSDPLAAMGGGAIVGALDTAALAVGLKGVLPHVLKRSKVGRANLVGVVDKLIEKGVPKSIAGRALAQGLVTAAAEGSTEAAQELTQDYVAEYSTGVSSDEDELTSSLINSFALGAIGGGPLGTVTGAVVQRSRIQRANDDIKRNEDTARIAKEVDQWAVRELENKELIELREYADTQTNIKRSDDDTLSNTSLGDQKLALIEKIKEFEKTERFKKDATYAMEEAGLSEVTFQDRVDNEINTLNALYPTDETLDAYIEEQGIADRFGSVKSKEDSIALIDFINSVNTREDKIFLLANYNVRTTREANGESKAGMDSPTFHKFYQELSEKNSKEELLEMARVLKITEEETKDLGRMELAALVAKRNAIHEINNSDLEALTNQTDVLILDIEEDTTSQEKAQKEIDKGRAIEIKAGNRIFTKTEDGEYLDATGEQNRSYSNFALQEGDVEKGLPIQQLTLRKGSFKNQQESFLGRFLASLKGGAFGFQPSGPLGFDGFMADRDRIGRLRAINKAAQSLAYQYEEARLAALQKGEILSATEADQLVMDYIRQSKQTIPLDKVNKAIKEQKLKGLEIELKTATDEQKASITEEKDFLQKQLNENVDNSLKVASLEELPVGMKEFAVNARKLVDTLSNRLLKELPNDVLIEKIGNKTRKQVIQENMGKYLTQSFKIYEPDLGYNPVSFWNRLGLTKGSRAAIQKVENAKAAHRRLNFASHPVKQGETLESIASATDSTGQEIKDLNGGIVTDPLQVGRDIKILGTKKAADDWLNDLMNNRNEGYAETGIKVMAGLRPEKKDSKGVDLATGVLKERQSIPQEYKELMGEINNPAQVLTNTVTRVASILENMRFYSKLEQLSDIPGGRLFSPVKSGLFTVPIEEKLGLPISGMYTTKQVAEAIGVAEQNKSALWKVYETMVLVPKIAIQAGKTVYSISAQMRNFMSASLFYISGGHFGGGGLVESINVLRDELFAGGFDTEGRPLSRRAQAEKTYRKLLQLGIINTNARLGEILKTFDEVAKDPGSNAGQIATKLLSMKNGKPWVAKLADVPTRLYTAADDFWKIAAWQSEKNQIEKIFKKDEKRLSEYAEHLGLQNSVVNKSYADMVDEIAAFKVRQTIPNYDYVGNFANMIRKTPFGNFIAFPTEIFRTGFNIVGLTIKDMRFSGMRGAGLKRGIGFGTATYGLGYTLQAIGQSMSDVTDEELKAAKKVGLSYWSKNSPIIPLEKIPTSKGGGFTYIDGSYILVYDEIAKIIPTVLNSYDEKIEVGHTVPASVAYGIKTAVLNVLEPFYTVGIGPDITKQILENTNANGNPIANTEDSPGDQAVAYLNYGWSKAQPGAWAQIQAVMDSTAADETSFKKYGKLQESFPSTMSLMGIRTDRVNPTLSFKYSINNYQKRLASAKYQFKDPITDFGLVTPGDILQAYDNANDSYFDIQQELYLAFLATQTLNGDQKEIKNQLKSRLPGDYSKLKKGQFMPFKMPKNSEDIYETVTEDMEQQMTDYTGGINTITQRYYPKRELRNRERFYRRGRFNLLLPIPPYED